MKIQQKQRIIISSYDDIENPYYAGGGAISVHEIARRLSSTYQITVLTGNFQGAKPVVVRDGVRYVRIGPAHGGPKIGQLAYCALLPYYARRLAYDVWIESFTPPFSTCFLPQFTDRPVVGLVHMFCAEDMKRKYHLPFDLVERAGIRQYDSFIVLNTRAASRIYEINPQARVAEIPNGIDLPTHTISGGTQSHILFLGRVEIDQKGLDLLLNSYKKVADRIKTPLVIAGSGESRQMTRLKVMVSKMGLQNMVHMVGRVSGDIKEQFYQNALCVVCPSRFETFSMIALESMAHRRCFVSFDIDGLSWMPDVARIKIKPYDIEALGNKLLELSENPALATSVGEQGADIIGDYNWDDSARRYSDFIKRVITTHKPARRMRWHMGQKARMQGGIR